MKETAAYPTPHRTTHHPRLAGHGPGERARHSYPRQVCGSARAGAMRDPQPRPRHEPAPAADGPAQDRLPLASRGTPSTPATPPRVLDARPRPHAAPLARLQRRSLAARSVVQRRALRPHPRGRMERSRRAVLRRLADGSQLPGGVWRRVPRSVWDGRSLACQRPTPRRVSRVAGAGLVAVARDGGDVRVVSRG